MRIVLFLVVVYLSVQFLRGTSQSKKILADLNHAEIDPAMANKAGLFGLIYMAAALLTAIPYGPLIYLVVPVPFVALGCVPGLILLHKLSERLDRAGTDRVKPVIEWADKGKLVGWITTVSVLVSWALYFSTTLLGSITSK